MRGLIRLITYNEPGYADQSIGGKTAVRRKPIPQRRRMFYLGIDVSLKSHRCALLDAEGEKIQNSFSIDASCEGFAQLLATLSKRGIPKEDLTIGLEATGHLWENLLAHLESKSFTVKLLNPFQTNRYRELLAKKAKTDDIDAYVIAGLLRSGEARSCYVPDDQIQGLRDLVRLRNTYLDNLQTYRRQATSLLQLVFPEVASVVKDPFGKVMRTILQQYPTAVDLAEVHPRKIEKIARTFQGNNFDRAKAEALVAAAKQSIYAGKATVSRGKVLASLLSQIAQLESAIEALDATIAASLDDSTKGRSDTDRLTSIPGVGPKTAAVLLAEIGEVSR